MKRIGGLVAVVLVLTGCSSGAVSTSGAFPHTPPETGVTDTFVPNSASPTAEPAQTQDSSAEAEAEVIYSVHSDGGILDATYQTASGEQQDASIPGTDWAKTVPANGLTFPILLAQNKGGGTITCTITYSDGTPTVISTSKGQYAIVTCNGQPN